MVSAVPTLKKICINNTHRSKALHLLVEIKNYVVEGLVDIRISMYVMVVVIVRKLGIMHMVTKSKTYKNTLGVITQALGRIDKILVKVGGMQCTMIFMVVDTDSYDVLLGLDFLIKIGVIVDVERGLIQVRHGPKANVEVLPLIMVNLLHRMNSGTLMQNVTTIFENTHINDDFDITDWILNQYSPIMPKDVNAYASYSDINIDNKEHYDGKPHQFEQIDDDNEFRDIELEDLVMSDRP